MAARSVWLREIGGHRDEGQAHFGNCLGLPTLRSMRPQPAVADINREAQPLVAGKEQENEAARRRTACACVCVMLVVVAQLVRDWRSNSVP